MEVTDEATKKGGGTKGRKHRNEPNKELLAREDSTKRPSKVTSRIGSGSSNISWCSCSEEMGVSVELGLSRIVEGSLTFSPPFGSCSTMVISDWWDLSPIQLIMLNGGGSGGICFPQASLQLEGRLFMPSSSPLGSGSIFQQLLQKKKYHNDIALQHHTIHKLPLLNTVEVTKRFHEKKLLQTITGNKFHGEHWFLATIGSGPTEFGD